MGRVRVVDIEGKPHLFNYNYIVPLYLGIESNMCCGTHVKNLSDIQCVKLLHTELKKGMTLLYFITGDRVLQYLQRCTQVEKELTKLLRYTWCSQSINHIYYIHLSIYPSINLSIHPSIHLSIHSSIHPFIHSSIHPFIYPSIYLSIYCSTGLDEHTEAVERTLKNQKQSAKVGVSFLIH